MRTITAFILIMSVYVDCTYAHILTTSFKPIVLNILKHNNKTSSVCNPKLFQQVLDLKPGTPFNFNIVKWKALIDSGLFSKLTARSVLSDDGVYLNISGIEQPTTYLTPEVSVVASLENPEVLGGITWKNINFRGMGEQLHASIMKKECMEEGSLDLDPSLSLKWIDNRIGKASRISFAYSADNVLQSCREVLTRAAHRAFTARGEFSSAHHQRLSVRSTSTSLKLQENVPIRSGFLSRFIDHFNFGIEPSRKTMRFTVGDDLNSEMQSILVGGTLSFDTRVKGVSISGWHEGGNTLTLPGSVGEVEGVGQHAAAVPATGEGFHTFGLTATLPVWRTTVVLDEVVPASLTKRLCTPTISLLQSTKFKAIRSWGLGRVSMHQGDLSAAPEQLVRGLSPTAAADAGRVDSAVSVKSDVYLGGLLPAAALVGAFCDLGLLQRRHGSSGVAHVGAAGAGDGRSELDPVCSVGVSLRAMGFRADYGYRLGQQTFIPQLHLGFDRGD